MSEPSITGAELRDQIAETIHRRICEHSREDCIENLGNCERATDSAMPLISTALDEGNVLARLLSDALNDAIRTLRELAEKAAGEPIPFDDVDLYAEMVDGALDAAADAAARPAENIAAILDRHETPDRAELRRLLAEATPGPWGLTYGRHERTRLWSDASGYTDDVIALDPTTERGEPASDMRLIVAAVNALPGLLDALEKAEAAIERVREMHASGDEWCGYHNSALCECVNVYCEECGADWPCPTVQALDRGGIDG